MTKHRVKGRVLFANLSPVTAASVEVIDRDLSPRGQSLETLGYLTTNDNGWFEGEFDLALLDAPLFLVKVSKDGRTREFDPLPLGEPQLNTFWDAPAVPTVPIPVKARVLYANGVPVGNAEVTVYDNDVGAPREQLGTLTTNENGWFEGTYSLPINDPPMISVTVRKNGRSHHFGILPPGEPVLFTTWSGPKRWFRHEDPAPLLRRDRAIVRQQTLRVLRQDNLAGSSIPFQKPLIRLAPLFQTPSPAAVAATPLVTPSPFYVAERNAASEFFSDAAASARSDTSLKSGERDSYKRIFSDHVPTSSSLPQTPVGPPRSIERLGDDVMPDHVFAEERIIGASPMVIARVGSEAAPSVPDGFDLPDDKVREITGWSLDELIAVKRVFVCDYRMLHPIYKDHSEGGASGIATIGLFFLADPPSGIARRASRNMHIANVHIANNLIGNNLIAGGSPRPRPKPRNPSADMSLRPLAIQLIEKDGSRRTRTPGSDEWNTAKLALCANDTLLHELRFHLWNCHLGINPVVLAMVRALDSLHPLYDLMTRHCYGALWINNYAYEQLVNPGGRANSLLGLTMDGVAKTLADSQRAWTWRSTQVQRDLGRRGVGEDALPYFPYRDDGLKLDAAIRNYAAEYVDSYYDNDAEVARDEELAAWFAEMASCGIDELPSLDNRANLAAFLADLIYQMAAYHGAVNSSQWDWNANALAMPAYLRRLEVVDPNKTLDQQLDNRLPTIDDAIGMMELMGQLGVFTFEPRGLGYYRDFWSPTRTQEVAFEDGGPEAAATRFRDALRVVGNAIEQRNITRAPLGDQYEYLHPSRLDNSSHK